MLQQDRKPLAKKEEYFMHKTLSMPIIDFHTHIMTDKRTASGMRWVQKMKNTDPSGIFIDTDTDLNLTSEKAQQMLIDAGVDYYFNMFFPIFEGTTAEVNHWNYELSLKDPRCVPFVSLLPGDDNKRRILDQAFQEYKCLVENPDRKSTRLNSSH